jgi:hypothetical protein
MLSLTYAGSHTLKAHPFEREIKELASTASALRALVESSAARKLPAKGRVMMAMKTSGERERGDGDEE